MKLPPVAETSLHCLSLYTPLLLLKMTTGNVLPSPGCDVTAEPSLPGDLGHCLAVHFVHEAKPLRRDLAMEAAAVFPRVWFPATDRFSLLLPGCLLAG